MESIWLFIIGLLVGSISMYIYMRKQGVELKELYTDSLLKNKFLKEHVEKSKPSKPKNWNKKKRYYGKSKQQS
tara:strand:+ start:2377 stop:2595 length:219 start_codon:yes stop_codon:yes gene_type:complete